MALNIKQLLRRAREYVEHEARMKVTQARFVQTFSVFGREDVVLSVSTTDRYDPECSVIKVRWAGEPPWPPSRATAAGGLTLPFEKSVV